MLGNVFQPEGSDAAGMPEFLAEARHPIPFLLRVSTSNRRTNPDRASGAMGA